MRVSYEALAADGLVAASQTGRFKEAEAISGMLLKPSPQLMAGARYL